MGQFMRRLPHISCKKSTLHWKIPANDALRRGCHTSLSTLHAVHFETSKPCKHPYILVHIYNLYKKQEGDKHQQLTKLTSNIMAAVYIDLQRRIWQESTAAVQNMYWRKHSSSLAIHMHLRWRRHLSTMSIGPWRISILEAKKKKKKKKQFKNFFFKKKKNKKKKKKKKISIFFGGKVKDRSRDLEAVYREFG